jgi:NAD(P)-dependent dehydrogenase (short-subunit alcohol dehydrogenase family)
LKLKKGAIMAYKSPDDQFTMRDPRDMYPKPKFPNQTQAEPGLAKEMEPKPDHGEESYKGFGRLKGRKAIVTGGDSGIGRAVAIAYAREGADVVLAYLQEERADAQEVIELLTKEGAKVTPFEGDLSNEATCKELIAAGVKELGGLDLLTIVAGKQIAIDDIAKLTSQQFDETFRTNVYALFWLTKAALPHLLPGASIVTTTSIQAYQPSPFLLDYAATKGAIVTYTKALAAQLAHKGIRVNAVAPGPFWTPLQPSYGQPPEKIPEFGTQSPFGRPGQPAEIAPTYVLLASQESSYITGETFGVTGGNPRP